MKRSITISTSGTSITHVETSPKRYVAYIRALEYLKVFSENKLTNEEVSEMRKEIETLKENDEKNINKTGIIDIDLFLTVILMKYR